MKYIKKECKKCHVKFNTRPCYNKEYCRKCWNTLRMKKVYRKLHPEERVIFVKGDIKESKKQWAKRNREKIKEIKLRYRYEKGGTLKDKEWQKANPEKVKASKIKYQDANKDKKREYHLKDRRENPEKYRERSKAYYRKYPEKIKESCRRRRVRKLNCVGFHTQKEFIFLKNRTGNSCLCCGMLEGELKSRYKNKKHWKLTEDHIIPLVKKGTDNIDNIQPLCFHCNSVKNNKIITLEELRKII